MAILNPQPPVIDGITYPFLGFSQSISTHVAKGPNGPYMEVSICCTMYPYRDSENGPVLLSEEGANGLGGLPIVYAKALESAANGDADIATYLAEIQAAAQKYINSKV